MRAAYALKITSCGCNVDEPPLRALSFIVYHSAFGRSGLCHAVCNIEKSERCRKAEAASIRREVQRRGWRRGRENGGVGGRAERRAQQAAPLRRKMRRRGRTAMLRRGRWRGMEKRRSRDGPNGGRSKPRPYEERYNCRDNGAGGNWVTNVKNAGRLPALRGSGLPGYGFVVGQGVKQRRKIIRA
jgi:hypothetical protein